MVIADILNPSYVLGTVLKAKGLKSSSSSIKKYIIQIPKLYLQVSPDLK